MKTLPVDYLHECFELCEETGELTWKLRPETHFKTAKGRAIFIAKFAGNRCGSLRPDGYLDVFIGGKLYLAHRIVFAMHYGYWPDRLDHLNGVKNDNRPSNLRACSQEENMRNQGSKATKTTPLKGAYFNKRMQRWQSSICANYKSMHLGTFDSAAEAHAAYVEASSQYHGAFANSG